MDVTASPRRPVGALRTPRSVASTWSSRRAPGNSGRPRRRLVVRGELHGDALLRVNRRPKRINPKAEARSRTPEAVLQLTSEASSEWEQQRRNPNPTDRRRHSIRWRRRPTCLRRIPSCTFSATPLHESKPFRSSAVPQFFFGSSGIPADRLCCLLSSSSRLAGFLLLCSALRLCMFYQLSREVILMIRNSGLQLFKLHAEIVAVCTELSELEVDDVLRMQFLLATVCESARLLPAGPLLQRCSLQHDLTLATNITIPAGAILAVPLHLVQTDVSMWGNDACQFNPSRFLQKGINLGEILAAHKGSNGMKLFTECDKTESFLPFGSGSRACLGQKFAILGISMLIASLLRNYEVQTHPVLPKEVDSGVSNNLRHLPNPKIILTKRII